jgi:eukaryotic-like serine/threonine-protein kinase
VIAGRYRIRGLIGKGGMAQVFLAEDMKSGDPVAVKILEPRLRREARMRARFMIEAKAIATVVHPSVVQVIDIGLHEEVPYLVMEFLFGESLDAFLVREKRIDLDRGLTFVRQIASGLAVAHRAGVIHRDLKPGNIFLVGEKGSPYEAKVVDFGLAKLYEHGGLTQSGMTVGTVDYMAPEQTVSDAADARTDVYGLGILMYRMFSGRAPFQLNRGFVASSSKMEYDALMLAHQLITEPLPPQLGDGTVQRALEAVIMKAIRKRPENRYPAMESLLDDLSRLGAPHALAARAPIQQPDVYQPKTVFSQNAARFFYRQLGKELPAG